MSDIVQELKMGKLSAHKYVDNVEKEPDKINMVHMSDKKDYVEGDEISKNDDVALTDVDE